MSLSNDIFRAWARPAEVMRAQLAKGRREDRALMLLMAACLLIFVAQLPRLAREAHLTGQDLQMLMGGTLLAWIFVAPLLLYVIALLARGIARLLGGRGTAYGARLALFWALLASTPLILLHGLVGGFIGPGPAKTAVGLIWTAVFLWFWIGGMLASERRPA